jgi:hypothetical protein
MQNVRYAETLLRGEMVGGRADKCAAFMWCALKALHKHLSFRLTYFKL